MLSAFSSVGVALNQTAPGGGTFQGQGTMMPTALPAAAQLAPPTVASGFTRPPGQWAMMDLDKQLGQIAGKLAPLLSDTLPQPTRINAAGAIALLNAVRTGYEEQLTGSRSAAWDRPAVRRSLQLYRITLTKLDQAADAMHLALQGRTAAAAPAAGTVHWPGSMQGMGVWSIDPNKWGMTVEEARAYDQANADAAVKLQQAAAAATNANPGLVDTLKQSIQTTAKAAASATNLLMFVGVTGAAALVYWAFKDPERGARAAGSLAQGSARAAGSFAGGATRLAFL